MHHELKDGVAAFWDVPSLDSGRADRRIDEFGVDMCTNMSVAVLVDGGAKMPRLQLVIQDRKGSLASHAGMPQVRPPSQGYTWHQAASCPAV